METSKFETTGTKKQTRVDFKQMRQAMVKIIIWGALLGGVALAVYNRGDELAFALFHPSIVREVRMVYQSEHEQADKNIINRQRYEFVSPSPDKVVTETVKK